MPDVSWCVPDNNGSQIGFGEPQWHVTAKYASAQRTFIDEGAEVIVVVWLCEAFAGDYQDHSMTL